MLSLCRFSLHQRLVLHWIASTHKKMKLVKCVMGRLQSQCVVTEWKYIFRVPGGVDKKQGKCKNQRCSELSAPTNQVETPPCGYQRSGSLSLWGIPRIFPKRLQDIVRFSASLWQVV